MLMEKPLVPLMIRFKRPAREPETDFIFDEETQLNVSLQDGCFRPAVLLPNSVAKMKTAGQTSED